MVSFIDEHRAQCGVEPICKQLPIVPSVDYKAKARQADLSRPPACSRRDVWLGGEIKGVHNANFRAYGARKVDHRFSVDQLSCARRMAMLVRV